MITRQEYLDAVNYVMEQLERAKIVLTPHEYEKIEVADFGLGKIKITGLQLITYVNTSRVCAKELILYPHQTCPEHYHPSIENELGKEETFRCRAGEVFLYIPGPSTQNPFCIPPQGDELYYTVFHEIHLRPGEQYTLPPDTKHWFQAGKEGAIISEFSTTSRDELDIFTDPRIKRKMMIIDTPIK